MRIRFFTSGLLFYASAVIGQDLPNLVPNPGFENNTGLPTEISQLQLAAPWQSIAPGGEPADYFISGAKERVSVPRNFNGTQEAHGGQAYAGFIPYSRMDDQKYREFVLVYLN